MTKPLTASEASAGHNRPAVLTADMLARDFGYLDKALAEVEQKVVACPPVCEDDADLEDIRAAVKRCQGAFKRLETLRVENKEPYLSAERINDAHFNKLKDIVARWQADIEAVAHRYLKKKEAAERAIREEEARKTAEAARKAAEAARKAEDERIAAEQAILAQQLVEQHETEAQRRRSENARLEETRLRETALQTSAAALKAQKEAEAKPAELARTRSGDGLSTLQEFWTFEVTDPHAVNLEDPVLRSFISWPDVEKAIRRYVELHKGDRPLKGVRIYSDTKPRMT